MDRLKTDHNGGMGFELDDIRFWDEANRNAFYGILSAFGVNTNETFILSGCQKSVSGSLVTVSEGYVSLEGEVCYMPEQNYSYPSSGFTEYITLDVSYDSSGNEVFQDGNTEDTYELRRAKVQVSTTGGVNATWLNQAKTLFEVIEGNIRGLGQIAQNTSDIAQNAQEIAKQATETILGRIMLATQSEANAGTNHSKAITPLRMRNYIRDVFVWSSRRYLGSVQNTQPPLTITHNLGLSGNYWVIATPSTNGLYIDYHVENKTSNSFEISLSTTSFGGGYIQTNVYFDFVIVKIP